MRALVIAIMFFQSLNLFGQQNVVSVCDSIYNKILTTNPVKGWTITREDSSIRCVMVDTLCFMPGCCWQLGERCDTKKKDSVIMTIRFEEWSAERIENQRIKNQKIINVLTKELEKDRKKREGCYKIAESEFQANKYPTLKVYWSVSKNGKYKLEDVVRLPDATIGNTGVFVDLSFDYNWKMIYQEKPQKKLAAQIEYISYKILGTKKLLTFRLKYE